MTVDYKEGNKVKFYIDGKFTDRELTTKPCSHISYIGNSKTGSSPFGTFADLKIYPFILPPKDIQMMAKYHDKLEFDMPDKYHLKIMEDQIIELLMNNIKCGVESTMLQILTALARLSSKKECRTRILFDGGIDLATELMNHENEDIRFQLYKLLHNLQ